MITKNSVVKIQNLAVNQESRPAKSNPVVTWVFIYTEVITCFSKFDVGKFSSIANEDFV